MLASEVGGFLRIIPVATAHTSGGRTLTDTQLFDMTRMTVKPGGVEISNPASTGLAVRVPHQFPYGYAILAEVGDPNTKSLVVSHAGAENFLVYGNGQVFAREVNVMTGTFPDYVFAPDYKLMPLNDLRRFVGQQRHLPHFPSGSEVVKQGMNLGDLQKRLVQQVEDLALYILQLEERLAAMESSSGRKGSSGQ